jgi:hypothetical protein
VIHTNTKPTALNHNDSVDRKVAISFLEERGWYDIEEGGEHELDLVVPKFKRGADVESFSGNLESFKKTDYFRIPFRKQKYWSNQPIYIDNKGNQRINPYKGWFVDYIQFLNNENTELLWYSYKTIVPYHTNIIEWKGLYKKNYKGNQAKFIRIPFTEGIKAIQYWKLIAGVWTKINLENS